MRPAYLLLGIYFFIVLLSPVQVAALDGDESTASIPTFTKTLADNTLFYPDAFYNDSAVVASTGDYAGEEQTGTWERTKLKGESSGEWEVIDDVVPYVSTMFLNFTAPSNAEGLIVSVYAQHQTTPTINEVALYKSGWVDLGDIPATNDWENITTYDPDYFSGGTVMLMLNLSRVAGYTLLACDYAEVTFYVMHLADTDHYAESFADVSDIAYRSGSGVVAGDYGMGTDGDVAEIWMVCDTTDDEYVYYNIPSADFTPISQYTYIEYRGYYESASAPAYVYVEDTGGVLRYVGGFTTTPNTHRVYLGTLSGLTTDVRQVAVKLGDYPDSVASGNYSLFLDYMRIASETEQGWQHDCSTTQGVTAGGGGTVSSDADKVTLTADADGSTFDMVFDTTATAAALSCTYYPFLELSITDGSGTWQLQQYDGSAYATLQSSGTLATGTYRYNMRSQDTSVTKLTLTLGNSATLTYDWAKAYSIANWTVTQSSCTVNDYLYVSSSVLYSSMDGGTLTIDHDPAISVAQATYSVWNLTISTSDVVTGYQYDWAVYLYTGAWSAATYDETRGATPAGTVTDVKLNFYDTNTLTAVKFIEDATAPTVVRANVAPYDPRDDEAVTLSTVVTDPTEVYEVYFDAITYSAGFSDVAYYATEITDNVWTYEFSTLTAGYYCFKVVATDGANTNSLDYYSYIEVTVREREIVLSNPWYGEFESRWVFSAIVNVAVNYYIYDNDTLQSSGTKAAGFFSVGTDFLNTVGKHIVSIKFNTTTDDEWAGGSYDITTTLAFDSIDPDQDNETVTVGFRVVRSAAASLTWTAYESGLVRATGTQTINEGDFFSISFDKSAVNVEGNATIVFSDGTSTLNITVIYITVDQADYTTNNTSGTDLITEYYVNETLQVSDWRLFTRETKAYLSGYANMPCSYVVYQNDVEVARASLPKGTFMLSWDRMYFGSAEVKAVFSATDMEDYELIDHYGDEGIVISEGLAVTLAIGVPLALFFALLVVRTWGQGIIAKIRGGLQH